MCGIAGFLDTNPHRADPVRVLRQMAQAIAHRGPDDHGIWHDAESGIGLTHRRLSILDLSAAGHQPMTAHSGRYVMVFNGEIYNHLALRSRLEGLTWRGHSDTETLLAGFDAWGLENTLRQSTGMFALAVWDRTLRCLTLARDRLGEKPLYYGVQRGCLLFGSELKALRAHPAFHGEIDRNALDQFLRRGHVPAPASIHQDIRKLPPGTMLTLREGRLEAPPLAYWRVEEARHTGHATQLPDDENQCLELLDATLREAVAGQMVADVPLGAFLSGGVDSSLVTALMQAQSSQPVRTFSIGFEEAGFNEANHARAVAAHLGTRHTELIVRPEEALGVIPRLGVIYDEPFADASQIPTYLVCEMARRDVTVCLSGDGGDELFCGYNRYFWTAAALRRVSALPHPLRSLAGRLSNALSPAALGHLFSILAPVLPSHWRYAKAGDKLAKLGELLAAPTVDSACREATHFWRGEASLVTGLSVTACESLPETALEDIEQHMMALDQTNYLPDDILTKVDRAAMAVSLETRVPLLDHRVVELAWRIPLSLKVREGQGKWLLRQLLHRYVPPSLIDRPKMGFSVPIDAWLRGPLRDWAENLLDTNRLRREGWLNHAPIRRIWADHLAGRRNAAGALWNVLMFQAWLEQQIEDRR